MTFLHSNQGDLLEVTTGNGVKREYGYHGNHWLSNETIKFDNETWTFGYEHNGTGDVSSITYDNNHKVNFELDGFGKPTEVSRTGFKYATNVEYYPSGSINSFEYGNGVIHKTYAHSNGVPSEFKDYSDSETMARLSYKYYDNLSVKSITDYQNSAYSITNMIYDGLDRLTFVDGNSGLGNSTIKYDALGNIKSYSTKGRNLLYYYNNNVLTNINDTFNNKDYYFFSYDSRGNVTHNSRRGFTYNLNNQIISSGGNSYVYDGHNRRIKSIDSKGTTYTIYNHAGQLLYKNVNNKEVNYVYLGDKLIAKDGVKGSIGSHGRKHSRPYGEQIETAQNDVGYTGHIYDQDLGLNYMQARYYDPVIGRFYSNDPADVMEHITRGNPVHGFNRYTYANNNPYKYVDPDGEFGLQILGAFIGSVTAVTTTLIKTNGEASAKQLIGAAIGGAVTGAIVTTPGAASLATSSTSNLVKSYLTSAGSTGLAGASGDGIGQAIAAEGDLSKVDGQEMFISGAMASTGGAMSTTAKVMGASDKVATVAGAIQEVVQTAVTKPAIDAAKAREADEID